MVLPEDGLYGNYGVTVGQSLLLLGVGALLVDDDHIVSQVDPRSQQVVQPRGIGEPWFNY